MAQIKPTSCQLPGAIESGNLNLVSLLVAAIGAQWLCQIVNCGCLDSGEITNSAEWASNEAAI